MVLLGFHGQQQQWNNSWCMVVYITAMRAAHHHHHHLLENAAAILRTTSTNRQIPTYVPPRTLQCSHSIVFLGYSGKSSEMNVTQFALSEKSKHFNSF